MEVWLYFPCKMCNCASIGDSACYSFSPTPPPFFCCLSSSSFFASHLSRLAWLSARVESLNVNGRCPPATPSQCQLLVCLLSTFLLLLLALIFFWPSTKRATVSTVTTVCCCCLCCLFSFPRPPSPPPPPFLLFRPPPPHSGPRTPVCSAQISASASCLSIDKFLGRGTQILKEVLWSTWKCYFQMYSITVMYKNWVFLNCKEF